MENYLLKVLKEWKEFCKGHRLFAEAIEQVLLENARLQEENEQLKKLLEKNIR